MFFLVALIMIPSLMFTQLSFNNPNLDAYIGENNVGLQVNPALTGHKGNKPNQEADLNLGLFYQNKYTISNEQIIAVLNGRLITEFPLSSFNILTDISTNNQLALSNYAAQNPEFQKIYLEYKKFQELGLQPQESLDNVLVPAEEVGLPEDINAIPTDELYQEYEPAYETDEEYYYYYEEDTDSYSLSSMPQKYVAQLANVSNQISSNKIQTFSTEEFMQQHYDNPNLQQKDISFLIHYETIKKAYNELLKNYQEYLSNQQAQSQRLFDPKDPNEKFTVYLVGEQTKNIWAKKFALGNNNYQSYDDIVWYLQYELPLTKKDVRALHKIFQNNSKVSYYVQGVGGRVDFALSPYFIQAMKELLELYVRGAFIVDPDTEFPILGDHR